MHTVWRYRWMDGWIDGRMDGLQMFRRFRVACSCVTVCVFLILGEVGGGAEPTYWLAGIRMHVYVCVCRAHGYTAHIRKLIPTTHIRCSVWFLADSVCSHKHMYRLVCIYLYVYMYKYVYCVHVCV